MRRVDLLNRAGDFVVSVKLPPYQTAPDVLIWGERVFKGPEHIPGLPCSSYREVFAVAIPAEPQCLEVSSGQLTQGPPGRRCELARGHHGFHRFTIPALDEV